MPDLTHVTPAPEFETWLVAICETLGATAEEIVEVKALAKELDPSLPPDRAMTMAQLKERVSSFKPKIEIPD